MRDAVEGSDSAQFLVAQAYSRGEVHMVAVDGPVGAAPTQLPPKLPPRGLRSCRGSLHRRGPAREARCGGEARRSRLGHHSISLHARPSEDRRISPRTESGRQHPLLFGDDLAGDLRPFFRTHGREPIEPAIVAAIVGPSTTANSPPRIESWRSATRTT